MFRDWVAPVEGNGWGRSPAEFPNLTLGQLNILYTDRDTLIRQAKRDCRAKEFVQVRSVRWQKKPGKRNG